MSAESLHLCQIYSTVTRMISHHLSHILLARSKLLVMPTLKRRESYKGGGHWGHLRILPASLGKHQLSTGQYYRMAECEVVHSSIRPKDKADLSSIQDKLASWSMPFTCGCHLPAAIRLSAFLTRCALFT